MNRAIHALTWQPSLHVSRAREQGSLGAPVWVGYVSSASTFSLPADNLIHVRQPTSTPLDTFQREAIRASPRVATAPMATPAAMDELS